MTNAHTTRERERERERARSRTTTRNQTSKLVCSGHRRHNHLAATLLNSLGRLVVDPFVPPLLRWGFGSVGRGLRGLCVAMGALFLAPVLRTEELGVPFLPLAVLDLLEPAVFLKRGSPLSGGCPEARDSANLGRARVCACVCVCVCVCACVC